MIYSLTDFSYDELLVIIAENKEAMQKRNDEIDIATENMEASETQFQICQKRYNELNIFIQFHVMLLTALQEVKEREILNAN